MEIQVSDTIRLLIPRWIKKLGNRESFDELIKPCVVDGKKLHIGDYCSCIIGETLNLFDVDLEDDFDELQLHNNCYACLNFSSHFYDIINKEWFSVPSRMERLEEEFKKLEQHLREKHPEIIREAEGKKRINTGTVS